MANIATPKSKVQKPEPARKTEEINLREFALGRENYLFMLIGLVLIFVGFILMIGGGSTKPDEFNMEMFSFGRLTLSPILILAGFGVELYAIMRKPKAE